MGVGEDEELVDLTARAESLGLEIFRDNTFGYVLRRIGRENDLEDLREKLDGIEWWRSEFGSVVSRSNGHAAAAMPTCLGNASAQRRTPFIPAKETPLADRAQGFVPCPQPSCGGLARAVVEYPDAGRTGRIVHQIIGCQTCGYSGSSQAPPE